MLETIPVFILLKMEDAEVEKHKMVMVVLLQRELRIRDMMVKYVQLIIAAEAVRREAEVQQAHLLRPDLLLELQEELENPAPTEDAPVEGEVVN